MATMGALYPEHVTCNLLYMLLGLFYRAETSNILAFVTHGGRQLT